MAALGNAHYPVPANTYASIPPQAGPFTYTPWVPFLLGSAVAPGDETGSGGGSSGGGGTTPSVPTTGQIWPRSTNG